MSGSMHDDHDLEQLLRGERATPPAGLLERLQAEIPEHLETIPRDSHPPAIEGEAAGEADREVAVVSIERPRPAPGGAGRWVDWRSLSAAAALVVAVGTGFFAWTLRDDVARLEMQVEAGGEPAAMRSEARADAVPIDAAPTEAASVPAAPAVVAEAERLPESEASPESSNLEAPQPVTTEATPQRRGPAERVAEVLDLPKAFEAEAPVAEPGEQASASEEEAALRQEESAEEMVANGSGLVTRGDPDRLGNDEAEESQDQLWISYSRPEPPGDPLSRSSAQEVADVAGLRAAATRARPTEAQKVEAGAPLVEELVSEESISVEPVAKKLAIEPPRAERPTVTQHSTERSPAARRSAGVALESPAMDQLFGDEPTAPLEVEVVDSDDLPIAGAEVVVCDGDEELAHAATDAEGRLWLAAPRRPLVVHTYIDGVEPRSRRLEQPGEVRLVLPLGVGDPRMAMFLDGAETTRQRAREGLRAEAVGQAEGSLCRLIRLDSDAAPHDTTEALAGRALGGEVDDDLVQDDELASDEDRIDPPPRR
ncbi:MAG: hypothetical protein AAGC60_29530 [Acidobacteriota bacterium]